jgi:hypothetical protein
MSPVGSEKLSIAVEDFLSCDRCTALFLTSCTKRGKIQSPSYSSGESGKNIPPEM